MKHILIAAMAALLTIPSFAQDIKLPAPNQSRKTAQVSKALATRHSVREYSTKKLSNQDLSDICWAACGMSRDEFHRTAPTAMNKQEIRLFVITAKGAYEYLPKQNILSFVAKGDLRDLVAGKKDFVQEFVKTAPACLLMVIDFDKFGARDEHAQLVTAVDAGIVCENINLFCQAAGFVTVPRAIMDAEGLAKALKLGPNQVPVMNNPVGHPKK